MADVAGMTVIVLFLLLAAGEDGILAVDDDDMVTAVNMGSKGGLMLAAKQYRGLRRHTAQGLAGSVDYIPFAVNLTGLRHRSGHSFLPPTSFLPLLPFYNHQKV